MASPPLLGVVDLGSNSFRMFVARIEGERGGQRRIEVVDELKEAVRLAAGLTSDARLDTPAQGRALATLARFSDRLRQQRPVAVRAVATNTLRVAQNAPEFLRLARVALGYDIEVISGRDEARLIYVGASHVLADAAEPRLVIDIGGGSTELIAGCGSRIDALDSVGLGCVALTQRHFGGGRITRERWNRALDDAYAQIAPAARTLRWHQWQQAWGTSGTWKALLRIVRAELGTDAITRSALRHLRDRLVDAGDVARIELAGLKEDRRPVLPGGFVAAQALFDLLPLDELRYAAGALREGVLLELADAANAAEAGDSKREQRKGKAAAEA